MQIHKRALALIALPILLSLLGAFWLGTNTSNSIRIQHLKDSFAGSVAWRIKECATLLSAMDQYTENSVEDSTRQFYRAIQAIDALAEASQVYSGIFQQEPALQQDVAGLNTHLNLSLFSTALTDGIGGTSEGFLADGLLSARETAYLLSAGAVFQEAYDSIVLIDLPGGYTFEYGSTMAALHALCDRYQISATNYAGLSGVN